MRHARSLAHFWWDFVVGDDWRVAAGVALVLLGTALLAAAGVDAWWLPAPAVALVLVGSVLRSS